ncbi:hypothetical protein QVD17_37881 [Tagetes erecta]|uniref:Uncharacterized protein n=1 Tax=Tagetes erecta TaxID=13708 RepID=A0AAD8NKF6_TARER|nr:hypothetical protein QVD17_37881 [Tagetes erecta]
MVFSTVYDWPTGRGPDTIYDEKLGLWTTDFVCVGLVQVRSVHRFSGVRLQHKGDRWSMVKLNRPMTETE